MLSIKDLFKKQLARKLVDQYIGLYTIGKIIFTNVVKITSYNKNSSSCEFKLSSEIKKTSEGTKSKRTKTSRS